MPIVADAAVAVRADMAKFNTDLKSGLSKGTSQAQTFGQKFTSLLNPTNLAGGLAAAFAGSQVISFLGDATSAAAEFQDSVAATGVIFGEEMVPGMEEWADTAHAAFGASKQDALAAANVIATLGKSAGLAGEDLVGFSQQMVQLGGDLASMFGGTTQDAITAVGAALRGESEPIRRYGVLLDDATLRQRAFEMGLISTTQNALTPQQRVLAAHAEILEQTTDAQGDFARTSDGMANTQRELAAQFENMTIEIGEKLLPVMLGLANFTQDTLIPALTFLIEHIEELGSAATSLLGPVGDLLDLTSGIKEPLQAFADAIEESGRSAAEAQTMVDRFAASTGQSSSQVGDALLALIRDGRTFEQAWAEIGGNVVVSWGEDTRETARLAGQARENIGAEFGGTGEVITGALSDVPGALTGPFVTGSEGVVRSIRQMYVDIATTIAARESELAAAGGDAVAAWFEPMTAALKERELQRGIEELNDEILELQETGTNAQVEEAKGRRLALVAEQIELQIALANIGTDIEQDAKLSALLTSDFMVQGLHSEDEQIRGAFEVWRETLQEHLGGMETDATDSGTAVPQNMAGSLRAAAPVVKPAAEAVAGYVTGALDLADDAWGWGRNTANSYAAGLASGQGAVIYSANLLGYAAGRILGVQSEPDDPNSPLHGITKWGGNIAQTIADGILGELGAARFASNALATALVPSMAGGYGLDSASRLAAGVGNSSGTTIINQHIIQVEGKPKVIGSRDDILDLWEQEERF